MILDTHVAKMPSQYQNEKKEALQWARRRKDSGAFGEAVVSTASGPEWRRSLRAAEEAYLKVYESEHAGGLKTHYLNQNPSAKRGVSSTESVLQTIIKSCQSA